MAGRATHPELVVDGNKGVRQRLATAAGAPAPLRADLAAMDAAPAVLVRWALAGLAALLLASCSGTAPPPEPGRALDVASPAIEDGGTIPDRHTCTGEDVAPPLAWRDVPAETAELAVLMEDPDAAGGTFVHWVAAGIDPADGELAEGQEAPVEGTNDFGSVGYRGPCPPEGDEPHRYVLTVLAVDRSLQLPPGASAQDLRAAVEGAELARGQLSGRYARP